MRVLALAFLLTGCAGHEALRWKPPVRSPCGIVVCESRGGRIDHKTDCICTGTRSVEQIIR